MTGIILIVLGVVIIIGIKQRRRLQAAGGGMLSGVRKVNFINTLTLNLIGVVIIIAIFIFANPGLAWGITVAVSLLLVGYFMGKSKNESSTAKNIRSTLLLFGGTILLSTIIFSGIGQALRSDMTEMDNDAMEYAINGPSDDEKSKDEDGEPMLRVARASMVTMEGCDFPVIDNPGNAQYFSAKAGKTYILDTQGPNRNHFQIGLPDDRPYTEAAVLGGYMDTCRGNILQVTQDQTFLLAGLPAGKNLSEAPNASEAILDDVRQAYAMANFSGTLGGD